MQKRCIGIQESEFANKEAKYLCKISKNAKQDGELRQERQITTRMPNKNAKQERQLPVPICETRNRDKEARQDGRKKMKWK